MKVRALWATIFYPVDQFSPEHASSWVICPTSCNDANLLISCVLNKKVGQHQQALHKVHRLPQRHSKQHFQRETDLNSRIDVA